MNTLSINIDEQVKTHFNHFLKDFDQIDDLDFAATEDKIQHIRRISNDAYVMEQMAGLESMVAMIRDKTWTVTAKNAELIHATVCYVCNDSDLIPDDIPGLGYIDDCIVIDNTLDVIEQELSEYKDFSRTRLVYAKDEHFSIDNWQTIKNQESASRIRNRRQRRTSQSSRW